MIPDFGNWQRRLVIWKQGPDHPTMCAYRLIGSWTTHVYGNLIKEPTVDDRHNEVRSIVDGLENSVTGQDLLRCMKEISWDMKQKKIDNIP